MIGPLGRAGRGDVPVWRRLLTASPARLAGSVAGVGVALTLVLLIGGLSTGIDRRITVFEDRVGAQLYVTQPGTTSLLGSTSSIDAALVPRVAELPAVEWATRVRGFFSVQVFDDRRVPLYVVGADPGRPGSPWSVGAGRAPAGLDEITVSRQVARRAAVGVGDPIELLGQRFRVVGVADDADMFMASFVFLTHDATDRLLSAPGRTSFVLVGTDDAAAATAQIEALGAHVVTAETLKANDLGLKGQAYDDALALLVAVAFLVGTIVIASTVYSTVTEHRREYGVLKAMGAGTGRLTRIVLCQTAALAAAGLVAAAVLYRVSVALVDRFQPQFAIATTRGSILLVVAVAAVMSLVAALVPTRGLVAMAPAQAFQGG